MTDVNTIAARYIDLWNERSAARRRELLAANWANNATYVDPIMSGDGHGGIDALSEGVQKRFPDFRFKLLGKAEGYGNPGRISAAGCAAGWMAAATGAGFRGDLDRTAPPTARSKAPTSP